MVNSAKAQSVGSILHTCRVAPLFGRESNFRQACCLQASEQGTEVLPAWGITLVSDTWFWKTLVFTRSVRQHTAWQLRSPNTPVSRPPLQSSSVSIFIYRNVCRIGPSTSRQLSQSDTDQQMSWRGLETVKTNYLVRPKKPLSPRWDTN